MVFLNNNYLKSKDDAISPMDLPFNSKFELNQKKNQRLLLGKQPKYETYQENGQRRYGGPPKGWVGGPPPKGTEVFVNRLPRDCMEDEIIPIFESVGQIYCLRLMMDFSGTNRGFCFVQYTSLENAKSAVSKLSGHEIRPGRKITVTKSVDNCRLFIGHIPKELDTDAIKTTICRYTAGLANVILYLSPTDKKMNRGFCFVEYEDHRSAAMARRHLLSTGIPEWNSDVMIDWATPEEEVEPHIMERVTIMYVRNMMLKTTEKTIKEALLNFVKPEDIKRVRKMKDFAFVHFTSREVAQIAINKFNGFILEGAKVEATWAKPIKTKKDDLNCIKWKRSEHSLLDAMTYSDEPFPQWFPQYAWPAINTWTLSSPANSPLSLSSDCRLGFTGELDRDNTLNLPGFEDKPALQSLACRILSECPPAMALQHLANFLRWGEVCFGVYQMTPQSFTAQIFITRHGQPLFTSPNPYLNPAAQTPEEAKNLTAKIFFSVFIFS
ncbi:probable RNA-binding protein 46 isoform X2 [Cimex lectularius]|nr:probable RNA-binding protein 46 isoform X2 [Cimex lectularius]